MGLLAGTKIGAYEIIAPLGAGGMGEVYRATDTRLGREVAIKVLPASFSRDSERLKRFEQEARAAGQLNHPNILTVHEFGMHDGAPYVVSELLEGETLRQRLTDRDGRRMGSVSGATTDANARTPGSSGRDTGTKTFTAGVALPPRKAIDYGVQIANGLAAAHDKGIVHRDLKPENIFITRDGRVKILDFGLAKLIAPEIDGETRTQAGPATAVTDAGVVLGTAGYMSPEQVRAQKTDHRSDIFSFGTILYEMLSGKRAFHRDSSVETMSAILKDEPQELSSTAHNVSPALQRVVDHCLEKDLEARFQSARDLAFALEAASGTSGASASETALGSAAASRKKRKLVFATVGTLGLIVVGVAAFFLGRRTAVQTLPSFQRLTFRRGLVDTARFSPDGQTVLYSAEWEGGPVNVFSTMPGSPESRSLGLPPSSDLLAISSSGEIALLLRAQRAANSFQIVGTLAEMSLGGGAPREILKNVVDADWSPDGKQLAVVQMEPDKETLEYPIGKVLYETQGWIASPRISPDGQHIAFADHPVVGDDLGTICTLNLSGKKIALTERFGSLQGVAWSRSGNAIWFTAAQSGSDRELYSVTLSGSQHRIAQTPNDMTLFDVGKDGRVLVKQEDNRGEMVAEIGEDTERPLTWLDLSVPADVSADGKTLLFTEAGDGGGSDYSVYLRKLDGSPAVLLGDGLALTLSPDGQWVTAYNVSGPEQGHLSLLPTGPGQARQLTASSAAEYAPAWLPDGKSILFTGGEKDGGERVYMQAIDGGAPRAITPEGFESPVPDAISPDGKSFIARRTSDGAWVILPILGGPPRSIPGTVPEDTPLRWTQDDRSIYVAELGSSSSPAEIFRLDLATGKHTLVKELVPGDRAGFWGVDHAAISADGKTIVFAYHRLISNLYLLKTAR